MTQQQYYYGTGRRKTAIARVRIYNTPGGSTVNGKPIDEVFTVGAWLRQAVSPLQTTNMADKITVVAKTHGGGAAVRLIRAGVRADYEFGQQINRSGATECQNPEAG